MTVGRIYRFDEVFAEEVQAINARRAAAGRTDPVSYTHLTLPTNREV